MDLRNRDLSERHRRMIADYAMGKDIIPVFAGEKSPAASDRLVLYGDHYCLWNSKIAVPLEALQALKTNWGGQTLLGIDLSKVKRIE